jgi:hypothetical protein
LPPAPAPFVPKGAAVREEDDLPPPKPADRPRNGPKAKTPEVKDDDTPRIPKFKAPLPSGPVETDPPAVKPPDEKKGSPRTDGQETKEPAGDGRQAVEQYFIPADGGREPKAEIKVGFFNHSDREIQLDVNGEAVRLPTEQYVTLRLPRTFKWAEKGQKGTDVVVPPTADGIEIVFRK